MMKRCPWCRREVTLTHPRFITCGSPRCTRQQALARSKERRKTQRPWMPGGHRPPQVDKDAPDLVGRKRILDAMRAAMSVGMNESTAIHSVSVGLKERPAVVMSVWRSA
jgi:hypothetical protein